MIETNAGELTAACIPPSYLGPDGKLHNETEEDHRKRIESARNRLREIAEIRNGPDDPPR
jgi:hypothetical protein